MMLEKFNWKKEYTLVLVLNTIYILIFYFIILLLTSRFQLYNCVITRRRKGGPFNAIEIRTIGFRNASNTSVENIVNFAYAVLLCRTLYL